MSRASKDKKLLSVLATLISVTSTNKESQEVVLD